MRGEVERQGIEVVRWTLEQGLNMVLGSSIDLNIQGAESASIQHYLLLNPLHTRIQLLKLVSLTSKPGFCFNPVYISPFFPTPVRSRPWPPLENNSSCWIPKL